MYPAAIDAAAARFLDPAQMMFGVVGDRKQIDSQLATLGLTVEYAAADQL